MKGDGLRDLSKVLLVLKTLLLFCLTTVIFNNKILKALCCVFIQGLCLQELCQKML